jgi:hypothetical protein
MQFKILEVLKGGSLGKTELIQMGDGDLRVRKSISSLKNREYGEVRWHSQLKRLQRYNSLLPGLFPQVLQLGINDDSYYFDIEYYEGFCNLKSYFSNFSTDRGQIELIAAKVVDSATRLHSYSRFDSYPGSLDVYLQEEVLQKLNDACENLGFEVFSNFSTIYLNGVGFPSLKSQTNWLRTFVAKIKIGNECFTHGNLTLENILIHPESLEIRLIDPYDENIVDCKEADFSQILQCSSSHYGIMSDYKPSVSGASVFLEYEIPTPLSQFNEIILESFASPGLELNPELLDFLHVSQFVRMLPFKVQAGDLDKAILFYALSCKLTQEMKVRYGD